MPDSEVRRTMEKEIRKIAGTLLLDDPTTTREGIRAYRRLERQVQRIVKDNVKLSRWQKIRVNITLSLQELDEDLNREVVFRKKREG